MGSSFATDPRLYVHPQSLSLHGIPYGWHEDHQLNIYKHSASGTHRLIIAVHPGGWGSGDATTELEGWTKRMELLRNYLLSTDYPTGSPAFDIVSVRYPMHVRMLANQAIINPGVTSPYEESVDGVVGGVGPPSYPGNILMQIEAIQMATQWVRQNAAIYGWDPNRIGLWGMSAGATGGTVAALSPSRRFMPAGASTREGEFSVHSRVSCVLAWFWPVDMSPWVNHYSITSPAFGITEADGTRVRAQMERLLLVPKPDGTYPIDCEPTALCKAVSPTWRARACATRPELRVPIMSFHWDGEVTTAPGAGYTGVPPYLVTGHDYRQDALMASACADGDVSYTSRVISPTGFPGLQEMFESTFAESYAFLVANT